MSEGAAPLAGQIAADLDAAFAGQADSTPAPAPAESAPAPAASEEAQPSTPAPVAAPEVPKVIKTVAAGKEVEVPIFDEKGAVNPALLTAIQQAADYTRKMQAVAEMRREAEAVKLRSEAEAAAAKIAAERAKLPQLPGDDPFAQHQAYLQQQLDAQAESLRKHQELMQQEAQERMEMAREAQMEASRVALAAERKRLSDTYKLDDDDLEFIERRYLDRRQQNQPTTLEALAQERRAKLDAYRAEAVKEFKEKHRVGSDAGGAAVSATGTGTPAPLTPSSPGFAEQFASELSAALRR